MFSKACRLTLQPEIDQLSDETDQSGLKKIVSMLVTLSPRRKDAVLAEALTFAQARTAMDSTWLWMTKLARYYPKDIGILSPLFLNLICLSPGQAIYLPAGQMHAYLEGTGLELMANSDNVLRGGLTPKHVDVHELLKVLCFKSTAIKPILPRRLGPCEETYDTPAVEFFLIKITLGGTKSYQSVSELGPGIVLCIDGAMEVKDLITEQKVELKKGRAVFVSGSAGAYTLTGNGVCYTATVPSSEYE